MEPFGKTADKIWHFINSLLASVHNLVDFCYGVIGKDTQPWHGHSVCFIVVVLVRLFHILASLIIRFYFMLTSFLSYFNPSPPQPFSVRLLPKGGCCNPLLIFYNKRPTPLCLVQMYSYESPLSIDFWLKKKNRRNMRFSRQIFQQNK